MSWHPLWVSLRQTAAREAVQVTKHEPHAALLPRPCRRGSQHSPAPSKGNPPVSARDADGGRVWSVGLDRTGDRQPCLDLLGGVDLFGGPLQLAATPIGNEPGIQPL